MSYSHSYSEDSFNDWLMGKIAKHSFNSSNSLEEKVIRRERKSYSVADSSIPIPIVLPVQIIVSSLHSQNENFENEDFENDNSESFKGIRAIVYVLSLEPLFNSTTDENEFWNNQIQRLKFLLYSISSSPSSSSSTNPDVNNSVSDSFELSKDEKLSSVGLVILYSLNDSSSNSSLNSNFNIEEFTEQVISKMKLIEINYSSSYYSKSNSSSVARIAIRAFKVVNLDSKVKDKWIYSEKEVGEGTRMVI